MRNITGFYRPAMILVLGATMAAAVSACASKGYVRKELQSTAGQLSTRIDTAESKIQANSEQIKGNTGQIEELSALNRENAKKITTLNDDASRIDAKAGKAQTTADQAKQNAEDASQQVGDLDTRFSNRNKYQVLSEKFVYFKFNSDRVDKDYYQMLDELAATVQANPDAVLTLEGHTDATGDAQYNIQLGERRLDAVVRYLVVEKGLPMYKLYKMSFGEAHPLAASEASKNRCTVLRVLVPTGSKAAASTIQ